MIGRDFTLRGAQVAFARLHARLGWAGLAGLLAFVASAALAGLAWNDRQAAKAALQSVRAAEAKRLTTSIAPMGSAATSDARPHLRDVPDLLLRLRAIAVANGLGWAAADYRIQPAGGHTSASLEVHTRLSGGYPQVRRTIAQVLRDLPAATFHQLSLARPDSGAQVIEAKFTVAILLQDGPSPADSAFKEGLIPVDARGATP